MRTAVLTLLGALALAHPAVAADAALIAAAKAEKEVVWYTVQTIPQVVVPMVAAFEKKYGIKVGYVRANTTEIIIRVENEAKAGRVMCDVFDGTTTVPALKRDGLVLKWLPDVARDLPNEAVDTEGYWVATNFFVLVPGINTEQVAPASEPKSLEDLLDPRWKGKIAWGSSPSASAGPGFIGLVLREMGEEKGRAYIDRMVAQRPVGINVAARQVLDQVIAGEYAMGLMTFNHHAVISAAQGAPVKWLPLSPAMVNLSTASVAKDAPHPNAAKLLLDFLVSEDGQSIFRDNDYLPVHPKVAAKDPALTPDGVRFRGIFFTPEAIESQMPRWSKLFADLFR